MAHLPLRGGVHCEREGEARPESKGERVGIGQDAAVADAPVTDRERGEALRASSQTNSVLKSCALRRSRPGRRRERRWACPCWRLSTEPCSSIVEDDALELLAEGPDRRPPPRALRSSRDERGPPASRKPLEGRRPIGNDEHVDEGEGADPLELECCAGIPTFRTVTKKLQAKNPTRNGSCGVHSDLSFPVAISTMAPTTAIAVETLRIAKASSAGRNSCGRTKMMKTRRSAPTSARGTYLARPAVGRTSLSACAVGSRWSGSPQSGRRKYAKRPAPKPIPCDTWSTGKITRPPGWRGHRPFAARPVRLMNGVTA